MLAQPGDGAVGGAVVDDDDVVAVEALGASTGRS
jgi:hypothetical protein